MTTEIIPLASVWLVSTLGILGWVVYRLASDHDHYCECGEPIFDGRRKCKGCRDER